MSNLDRILIRDLTVDAIIGIYEWERQKPQEILINLTLYTDLKQAGDTDDLAYSIDYEQIAKQIQSLATRAQRLTVEALAQDIAKHCLALDSVERVCVRVDKPEALNSARSVGVEIERSRQDL